MEDRERRVPVGFPGEHRNKTLIEWSEERVWLSWKSGRIGGVSHGRKTSLLLRPLSLTLS